MTELKRMVPRVIDANDSTQLYTSTHLILAVPPNLKGVDSIAVLPGLGEHSRVATAIHIWQANSHLRRFFVAGTNKQEVEQPQLSLDRLAAEPFLLKRTEGVATQVEALHSREQTDWIVQQAKGANIKALALVVSHWHMPRAYRTLLKSMLNANMRLPIFPVVVGSPPSQIIPEYNQTVERLSAGEAERIHKYSDIGQIASFTELTDYLDWLWTQIDE